MSECERVRAVRLPARASIRLDVKSHAEQRTIITRISLTSTKKRLEQRFAASAKRMESTEEQEGG